MEPRILGDKHCHIPGDAPRFEPVLDPVDEAIALRVLTQTRGLSLWQLLRVAYETEPMRTILDWERQAGKELTGAAVDLGLARRNERFLRWQENKRKEPTPDEEYLRLVEKERAEVDELLASLD
jgi:hypothetical protein